MFQAAFLAGFFLACANLYRTGDERDYWAAVCIAMQTILVYWQIDNLLGIAFIYVLAGATFLAFSIKVSGAVLGIVSCLMALLTVCAYFGLIPSEKGQGMAFNYYHWATVMAWGQVGILGFMGHGNTFSDPLS